MEPNKFSTSLVPKGARDPPNVAPAKNADFCRSRKVKGPPVSGHTTRLGDEWQYGKVGLLVAAGRYISRCLWRNSWRGLYRRMGPTLRAWSEEETPADPERANADTIFPYPFVLLYHFFCILIVVVGLCCSFAAPRGPFPSRFTPFPHPRLPKPRFAFRETVIKTESVLMTVARKGREGEGKGAQRKPETKGERHSVRDHRARAQQV